MQDEATPQFSRVVETLGSLIPYRKRPPEPLEIFSNRYVGLCDLLPVVATEFVDEEALGSSEKLREVDGKDGSEMLAVW